MIVPVYINLKPFEASQNPLYFVPRLIYVTAFAYQGLLCSLIFLIFHHVLIVELAYCAEMSLSIHYWNCEWQTHHFEARIVPSQWVMQSWIDRWGQKLIVIAFNESSSLIFDLCFLYIAVDPASQRLRLSSIKPCTILQIGCLGHEQVWCLRYECISLHKLLLIEGLPNLVFHDHGVDLRGL